MVASAFLTLLLAGFTLQDPPPPPAEEEVGVEEVESEEAVAEEVALTPKEAADMLRAAFKDKKLSQEDLQEIVEEAGLIADPLVTKELGKALKHKRDPVRTLATIALRWNKDPSAFTMLVKAKRDKRLRETPATGIAYALALGQWGAVDVEHAEAAAEILAITVGTQDLPHTVTSAGIRALARCRVDESPSTVMDFLRAGPVRSRKFITDIRGAMFILLGHDAGNKTGDWTQWWSEHGKKMSVPKEPYEIPQELARLDWIELWKSPMQKEKELKAQEELRKKRLEERKKRRAAEEEGEF
jgi:hypothetical protein